MLPLALLLALATGCAPSPEEQAAAAAAAEATALAAREAEAAIEALRAEAEAQHETARLKGLWRYVSVPVEGEARPQRSASMHNQYPEADDAASFTPPPTVQLVLRDDPRWGQSVYLVIEEGDFRCGRPCAFSIRFDDAEPRRFAGEASSTGERPALFINDDAGFIRALGQAATVDIAPAGGGAPIRFETGGFDHARYTRGA